MHLEDGNASVPPSSYGMNFHQGGLRNLMRRSCYLGARLCDLPCSLAPHCEAALELALDEGLWSHALAVSSLVSSEAPY